jgi:hypothetical protein
MDNRMNCRLLFGCGRSDDHNEHIKCGCVDDDDRTKMYPLSIVVKKIKKKMINNKIGIKIVLEDIALK